MRAAGGTAGPEHGAFTGGIAALLIIWGRELGADRVEAAFLRHPSMVVRGADRGIGAPGCWLTADVSQPAHVFASQLLVVLDCLFIFLMPPPSPLSTAAFQTFPCSALAAQVPDW